MTNSYQQPGETLPVLAPYDRASSGLGAKVGAIFGMTCDAALSGEAVRLETVGVHEIAKTSAQAWAVGDRIYWDDSNKRADNVPTVGMLIGVATAIAANPTSTGFVKLAGSPPDLLEGLQAAVADMTAITGGESPTEAEHNLVITKINALLAILRIHGLITP